MSEGRRRTPRVPRTAFFDKVVPVVLIVLALLLVAVLLAVVLLPGPIAG